MWCVVGWASGFVAMCLFTCFAVLLSGPMVLSPPLLLTRQWSAAFELWIHICTLLLYQGTAVAHGEWVFRLVGVSTCSWVGAFVVASVRAWLIVCFRYYVLWVLTIYLMNCFFFFCVCVCVCVFFSPSPLWHSSVYHLIMRRAKREARNLFPWFSKEKSFFITVHARHVGCLFYFLCKCVHNSTS